MNLNAIEKTLHIHLLNNLPAHSIREVYVYATLPGGKLFRPSLVWSILQDLNPQLYKDALNNPNSSHALLASAIEFHHSYTLIHDDLPSMDNDTTRRGKPCTHLTYGEWRALLAGDGLLNLSYQLLTKIKNERTLELLQFFSWAMGPKGLIHGQVLDLSHEMTSSFESTLRTHELKTARLIQAAILGSTILAQNKNREIEKRLWKFSRLLGINFQLIDDLSELSEKDLSQHEKEVNPWIHHPQKTISETLKNLETFNQMGTELKLQETNKMIKGYYEKMTQILINGQSTIEGHLNNEYDLLPIILLMQSFG